MPIDPTSRPPAHDAPPPPGAPVLPGTPDRGDVYLAPHSDDVCFSLGAFAHARQAGTLLTVFPRSGYHVLAGPGAPASIEAVSRMRVAEDTRFARACGLRAAYLGFTAAGARGEPPFDTRRAPEVAERIARPLLAALRGPTIGRAPCAPGARPLLACPAGIGGHVDHAAVRLSIIRHLRLLEPWYRIGFYEDLHYASDPRRRAAGLEALRHALAGRRLLRCVAPMDDAAQALKMRLVALHASQLGEQLRSLHAFMPATPRPSPPHEALWMLQPARHQSSG